MYSKILKNASSVALLFCSLLAIIFFFIYDEKTLKITIILAFISIFSALYLNYNNFVYQYRVLIISLVGIIPSLAIFQDGWFSRRMLYVQTYEVAWIFSILVCTSLFSSQVGFWIADKKKFKKISQDLILNDKVKFWIIFFLIILSGYLISLSRGDFIIHRLGGFADRDNYIDMPVRNLQALVAILLAMLFFFLNRNKNITTNILSHLTNPYFLIFIFAIMYVVIWSQFLRGARMDPIGILIMFFVLYYSFKGQIAFLKIRYLVIAIIMILILQIWGVARNDLGQGIPINIILEKTFQTEWFIEGKQVMYFQGTFNNISTGVAGVIYAIENGLSNLYYGSSYVDYILRIPPESIYPERPKSLAWFTLSVLNDKHGGGFNEMAEIYLNFGIFGSLFLPGIISFVIGWSYRRHLYNPYNLWMSLPFIAILAVYTRMLIYQTFDGFKSWVTALILYSFLWLFSSLIKILFMQNKNS